MIILHKGVSSPLLSHVIEYDLIHFALEPAAQPNPALFVNEDTYVIEKPNLKIEALVFKPNDSDRILLKKFKISERREIKLTFIQKILKLLKLETKHIKSNDVIQKIVIDILTEEEVDLLRCGKLLRTFR